MYDFALYFWNGEKLFLEGFFVGRSFDNCTPLLFHRLDQSSADCFAMDFELDLLHFGFPEEKYVHSFWGCKIWFIVANSYFLTDSPNCIFKLFLMEKCSHQKWEKYQRKCSYNRSVYLHSLSLSLSLSLSRHTYIQMHKHTHAHQSRWILSLKIPFQES